MTSYNNDACGNSNNADGSNNADDGTGAARTKAAKATQATQGQGQRGGGGKDTGHLALNYWFHPPSTKQAGGTFGNPYAGKAGSVAGRLC